MKWWSIRNVIAMIIFVLFGSQFISLVDARSVVNSRHNLSVSGPGTIKADQETQICIFCHTPHSATSDAPLWNRGVSSAQYTAYRSSTAKASFGQPTGESKLCLSCHDGTVALGKVLSRSDVISFSGSASVMPPGVSRLGTDLSDDHPISFRYDDSRPNYKKPKLVKLDKNGYMQCTTCHDAHDDRYGKFLSVYSRYGRLCLDCHVIDGWSGSVHGLSTSTWNGNGPDPWKHTPWNTVETNACENCHRPHSAGRGERLLNYAKEEDNCLVCHNGNMQTAPNIASEFNKASVHPTKDYMGRHDTAESTLMDGQRHAECSDCHNSHAVNADFFSETPDGSFGKSLYGPIRYVRGIDRNTGVPVENITYEEELCFRCHGQTSSAKEYVERVSPRTNTREEFDPLLNASYHPVIAPRNNLDVPSLLSPYSYASVIECSSCHNNSSWESSVGRGPKGPHGSKYFPLLERRLDTSEYVIESSTSYALCYKCHDRNNILGDNSFAYHRKHIVEEQSSCTVCHDPHGVRDNTSLINFDRNVVFDSPTSPIGQKLLFEDLGQFSGRCYLSCHGSDHAPETYGGASDD